MSESQTLRKQQKKILVLNDDKLLLTALVTIYPVNAGPTIPATGPIVFEKPIKTLACCGAMSKWLTLNDIGRTLFYSKVISNNLLFVFSYESPQTTSVPNATLIIIQTSDSIGFIR